MALDVILANAAAPAYTETIELHAENCSPVIRRQPIVTPLPGGTTFVIDLGMVLREIRVTGICTMAQRNSLEIAATTWYLNGYVRLQESSYDASFNRYYGQIKDLELKREAAKEDRYSFSLTFSVESKV